MAISRENFLNPGSGSGIVLIMDVFYEVQVNYGNGTELS
jgi:hypothetical protein